MSDRLRLRREMMIHSFRNAGRGGKVGLMKLQPNLSGRFNRGRRLLHDGPARDASQGGMIHGLVVQPRPQ